MNPVIERDYSGQSPEKQLTLSPASKQTGTSIIPVKMDQFFSPFYLIQHLSSFQFLSKAWPWPLLLLRSYCLFSSTHLDVDFSSSPNTCPSCYLPGRGGGHMAPLPWIANVHLQLTAVQIRSMYRRAHLHVERYAKDEGIGSR